MSKYPILLFILLILLLPVSCNKNNEGLSPEPSIYSQRTVIAYMVADNNLYDNALEDLNEMKAGWNPAFGRLVVYVDYPNYAPKPNPHLMLIGRDKTNKGSSTIVKEYAEQNSASADVLRQVILDCTELYPSESYGLVLWSHGTGWLPPNALNAQAGLFSSQAAALEHQRLVKTYAADNGQEMGITDLASALPFKFDFILFDACFMGGVEVAYELRDKADYLIASAAEILVTGFPYETAVPTFYEMDADYSNTAQVYFNHYNSLTVPYRSATIAVIKTAELEDLAQATKSIFARSDTNMSSLNRGSLQMYDSYTRTLFFDFEDFVQALAQNENLNEFETQLNKTVIFKANTNNFLGKYDITKHCGLSTYIPYNTTLNTAYKNLAWYDAVGVSLLIQ